MKIAVFAYNFPHKKTQEVLFKLKIQKIPANCVIAAPRRKLKKSNKPPLLRVKPRYTNLDHPKKICKVLNFPYYISAHNSKKTINILKKRRISLGVIAGARIISESVIRATTRGILNLHPGLIPQVRGMDALKWAILENKPLGVTAHLIDKRVDAGRVVLKKKIAVYEDDTFVDLALRLDEESINILPSAIDLAANKNPKTFPKVGKGSKLHYKMEPELEKKLPEKLKYFLKKWTKKNSRHA